MGGATAIYMIDGKKPRVCFTTTGANTPIRFEYPIAIVYSTLLPFTLPEIGIIPHLLGQPISGA